MATRSPSNFHNFWGQYSNIASLPGVPSAEANLQTGDTAYTTDTNTLYVCTDDTPGSVVWSESGITELTGDVEAGPGSGSQAATVVGIQNNPVSATTPNTGDVLVWDGTEWVPTSMTEFTAANFDAFGRLRVSNPQTIFDAKTVYDAQPLYFAEEQTGGAAAGVWSASNASVALTVAANQTSVRQSRRYLNYQPGKSQLIFLTFNLNGIAANTIKRAGYYEGDGGVPPGNGFFLELSGGVASLHRRSSSSTASVSVNQASWNLDPMNGSGPSGVTLDFSDVQILVIDFEWLGVGSARMGFVINGQIVYAHRFDCANVDQAVYMSTPNLPVRWEIQGLAGLVGTDSINCICASVNSEGGLQSEGTQYAYVMPALTTNVPGGATRTLLSIRHTTAYPRVTVIPINVSPCSDSNGVNSWELVYNPTLAGATWGTVNRGYLDIDIAGTATGGTILEAGTFTDQVGAQNLNLRDTTLTLGNPVVVNNLGTPSTDFDVISLRVKNLSGNNHTFVASLAWIAVT